MKEENNEVLKYLWSDIALYAVFTEFHVFGSLLRLMSKFQYFQVSKVLRSFGWTEMALLYLYI